MKTINIIGVFLVLMYSACTVTLPAVVHLKDSSSKPEEKSRDFSVPKRKYEQRIDVPDVIKITDQQVRLYDLEFIKSSLIHNKIPQITGIGIEAHKDEDFLPTLESEQIIVPPHKIDTLKIRKEKSAILGWIIVGAIIDLYISAMIASKALGEGLR